MTKVRKTPVITLSMVEFRGTKLELCEVPGAFFVVAVGVFSVEKTVKILGLVIERHTCSLTVGHGRWRLQGQV